ncbi:hypothetical protein CPB84DRAFT_1671914 [Gymnopilus junonius]|uniref:Uncharacterized protein n=1 Tax=Gymnopilus junonius TaxID=109634 RepID=A0A9P5NZB8_GYMJU|nr:hypothetical protein CPB84DRAFT_1671914 [Gymnopilus junonius]
MSVKELPQLPQILQWYSDHGVLQKNVPRVLEKEYGVTMMLQTVQKYSKDFNIVTVRQNGLMLEEQALAINIITEEDPIGQWGCCTVQEKLALQGIHIHQDGIMAYQAAQDKDATDGCNPYIKKAHPHGLWSLGPNEEWCIDGHEKILKSMGIAVWGIADKCAHMELGLWAMPNARVQELPPALYLQLIKKQGDMALSTMMDKGTEVGKLISLVKSMRALYADVPEDILPSFKAVKSTFNITRERSWHPLWEKELSNVTHEYQLGKIASGFHQGDPTHVAISSWLWGQIIQKHLDKIVEENQNHKIRKQKKILLPSSTRHIDIYNFPEDHELIDCLIKVPEKDIDQLLLKFDQPDLLQFGTDEEVALCEKTYAAIGSPILLAKFGWEIFCNMVNYCIDNNDWEAEEEGV